MNASLKAIAAMLVLAVAAPTVHAQGGGPPGGRGGRMMEMMMTGITLDAAQKAKVDSIVAKHQAEMPPMQQGQMPDSATRAARREHMMKQQDEIRAVLTPDQQKVFDKNVADMRERMRGRGPGGPGEH